MNKKLDNPPTPKILMGIANASNYITTYDELMEVCGYFKNSKLNNENNIAKRVLDEKLFILDKYHLNNEQLAEIETILMTRNGDDDDILRQISHFTEYITVEAGQSDEGIYIPDLYKDLLDINHSISTILERYQKVDYEYPIPLYDHIPVNYHPFEHSDLLPIKYINLNIELESISKIILYFGLTMSDNSMAPLLDIGDIAIIYEKPFVYESGGTYLLQINNSSPIIRKIIDTSGGLELHAMNMWNYPIQKVSISDIRIIGKVIRVENTSFFK